MGHSSYTKRVIRMTDKIKLALGGYGRMNKIAANTFSDDPDITVVVAVDPTFTEHFVYPFETFHPDVLNTDKFPEVDVWLDFSTADAALENIPKVVARRIKPVIATTGIKGDKAEYLRKVIEDSKTPSLWEANYSLEMFVMKHLVREAARLLPPEYDIEVSERHHRRKKDGPSGSLLNILVKAIREFRDVSVVYREETKDHLRTPEELGVSYQRAGDNPGRHEVVYAGNKEELIIIHQAFDPSVFIDGAREGILYIHKQDKPGIYGFKDVLGLK